MVTIRNCIDSTQIGLLWFACALSACAPVTPAPSTTCDDGQSPDDCRCVAGESEADCEPAVEICDPDSCINGVCTAGEGDGEASFCSCSPGWAGPGCDQDIDDCDPNPCLHGTCSDGVDSYECTCEPEWSGANCDEIDGCAGDADADADGTPDGCDLCPTDAADDQDGDGFCDTSGTPTTLHFQPIAGGSFLQGSNNGDLDEQPVREVRVAGFEILRTEVTVAQFAACVAAGACDAPQAGEGRNWNDPGYENHPINAVDRFSGEAFCAWAGGRLPTESEWEYAARSRGAEVLYPWGDDAPSCQYASIGEVGAEPYCGTGRTSPVCARPAGNTAQSLCDMAGNVSEWVQDHHHLSYEGAPTDGSSWGPEDGGSRGVNRGGNGLSASVRTSDRNRQSPSARNVGVGFRCARDVRQDAVVSGSSRSSS